LRWGFANFLLKLAQTAVLPISASQEVEITGMSLQNPHFQKCVVSFIFDWIWETINVTASLPYKENNNAHQYKLNNHISTRMSNKDESLS
jgi:hypothetical protein